MPPRIPSSLGLPVSTRQFSFLEMVSRAWGSEFFAPDHRVYQFGGVRFFDSTDLGFTGIYSPGVSQVSAFTLTGASNQINPTAVDLTWTLATVYGDEIDFYNIFRSVNGGTATLLVSINATQSGFQASYIDSNLNPSNTYTYYIEAIADVGSTPGGGFSPATGLSNSVSFARATPPVLSGTLIGTTEVDLTWTASTVVGSTIQSYSLYRQVDGGGFSLLTTTAGNILAFNDVTVSIGHTYDYYVVAQPVSGFQSLPSNTVTEVIASALDAIVDLDFTGTTNVIGVTGSGNAAWSNDGGITTNAVIAPVPTINQFQTVVSGNGIAVAMGQNPLTGGALATSSDNGHTWTDTTPGTAGSIIGVYFSPMLNEFIAWDGGSPRTFTSPDGVTWTSHVGNRAVPTFTNSNFVETGGLLYVGSVGSTTTQVSSTPDGITYTGRLVLAFNAIACTGPVLNGTVFGASPITSIFGTNEIDTSPTGAVWTLKSTGGSIFTTPPYANIQAFGGVFVTGCQTGGDGKTIATSPDGVTWTNHTPTPVGLIGNSGPAIRATSTSLYVFGAGCAHTNDLSSWTLDIAVTNTISNVKANGTHVVGCGADAGGNGLFFKVS